MLFNIEEFDIKLDTEFIGRNFIYCDEVESTNELLLNSKDFNQNGTVLLAEHQSKGKGRKDKVWISSSGQNLTFSVLLKGEFKSRKINLINLGTSLAIAQAIENLCQLNVELKWPNDVLIDKKKIAGILLESTSKNNKVNKIVIGIGINVNQPNFPGKFDIPPTSIRKEFHSLVNRERLLSEVLNNLEQNFETAKEQSDKIMNDWRSRCKMIGEKVKIIDDERTKFGIFEDIDDEGFMILRQGDFSEKIHYGDVNVR